MIGEKLLEFVRASNTRREFAGELSDFAGEVKKIFTPDEIRSYFENLTHVGTAAHVLPDDESNVMRDAGALDTSVVRGAEDVIIVARMREMLSEESAR